MSEPKTKMIKGVEAVAFMNAGLCTVVRPNFELRCLSLTDADCNCPGASTSSRRGRGIWITKEKYLELRLMGEVE